jgi:hypothetical protein
MVTMDSESHRDLPAQSLELLGCTPTVTYNQLRSKYQQKAMEMEKFLFHMSRF